MNTIAEIIKAKDIGTYNKLKEIGDERQWQRNGQRKQQKHIPRKQKRKD
mgnify:CR=1 FL=1